MEKCILRSSDCRRKLESLLMPVLWRMLPSLGIVMELVPSTDMVSNRRCQLQEL